MTNNPNNRIAWLDAAKGIAIILVVLGHIVQNYTEHISFAFQLIYSFHMPAFFVFSGYLINEDAPFLLYVKKKVKSLLLPYLVFATILFIYDVLSDILINKNTNAFTEFKEKLINTLLVFNSSYFFILWFLPCLFTALIIFFGVLKVLKNELLRFITVSLLSITILFLKSKFVFELPLCADTALFAVFWLYLGHFISYLKHKKSFSITHKTTVFIICSTILLLINIIVFITNHGALVFSFRNLYFNNIFVYILTACFGTAAVILLGSILQNSKSLLLIGKESLYIYGLHFILIAVLAKLLFFIPSGILFEIIKTVIIALLAIYTIMFGLHFFRKIFCHKESKNENSSDCTD